MAPGGVARADGGPWSAHPGGPSLSAPVSPQTPVLPAQGGIVTTGALVCQAEADGLGSHCHQSLCVSFTGSLQRVRGSPGNSGTILMRKYMTCTTPESRAVRGSCFKVYRVFLVAVETGGAVLALGGGGAGLPGVTDTPTR